MSLARMGAHVTAVDFSAVAIKEAKAISKEINVPVNFIESSVLELELNKKFDIIFSSYGAIGWLPDLNKWGETISRHLKKGGTFLLTEFHPFIDLIDQNQYDYFFHKNPDINKRQPHSELDIYSTFNKDIYSIFSSVSSDNSIAFVKIMINPLVKWVWIGGYILAFGTIIALWPRKD